MIGMKMQYGPPGDVERNRSGYMDPAVGKAKTAFAGQGNRGNWGFNYIYD
jgi:hypothetical protein